VYRAVSDQLVGDESLHALYRNMACDYILAHRDHYEPFVEDETFEEYLADIAKEGVWAGNIELQALSLALDVNILIHRAAGPPTRIESSMSGRWIHLAYQLGNHYNSIRLMGNSAGPAEEIPTSLFEAEVVEPVRSVAPAKDTTIEEVVAEIAKLDTGEVLRNPRPDTMPGEKEPCWCGSKKRYYKCCQPYDTFKT